VDRLIRAHVVGIDVVLTEIVTVVRTDDDGRVVVHPLTAQFVQDGLHVVVRIGDGRIVAGQHVFEILARANRPGHQGHGADVLRKLPVCREGTVQLLMRRDGGLVRPCLGHGMVAESIRPRGIHTVDPVRIPEVYVQEVVVPSGVGAEPAQYRLGDLGCGLAPGIQRR
jgi:hypothetical protein